MSSSALIADLLEGQIFVEIGAVSEVEFLREDRVVEVEVFVVSDEVSGVLFGVEFWLEDRVATGAIFPCPDVGREEIFGVESDAEKVVAEGGIFADSVDFPERDFSGKGT